MPIYVLRAGDEGSVKIGLAQDVGRRVASLQTASPVYLSVIRIYPGGRQTERWLHERFAANRLNGEWFDFVPEMLTAEPPAEVQKPQTAGQSVIVRLGGVAKLARALGHSHVTTVQGWVVRGVIPSRQMGAVLKAAKDLGIALTADDLIEDHDTAAD